MSDKKDIEEPEEDAVEIIVDHRLKTIWLDDIFLAQRDDGICALKMTSTLPDGVFEQGRFMMSEDAVKRFIDMSCNYLKYTPETIKKKKTIK